MSRSSISIKSLAPLLGQTRKGVIANLARASNAGTLGLFVGTGFSIAATGNRAHNFESLLREAALHLQIPFDLSAPNYRLKSLPQIASQLLKELRKVRNSDQAARRELQSKICELCNYIPDVRLAQKFQAALNGASPSWIITTNYDLILEALIETSESILPAQPLFPNTRRVPIYHLHGHRQHEWSICITEEDYVSRLAPLDYQRLKLPLLFSESTTLFLGYAVGDINVRAAMEWSKSLRGKKGMSADLFLRRSMVQVVYEKSPSPDPYEGPDGQTIIESDDVADILREVATAKAALERNEKASIQTVDAFLSDPKKANAVAEEGAERNELLEIIEKARKYVSPAKLIYFLQTALDPIWKKARVKGGFPYYKQYLGLVLDIMTKLEHRSVSPLLVAFIAQSLERVGWYIDPKKGSGSAHEATDVWLARCQELSPDLISELRVFANSHWLQGLTKMLDVMPAQKPTSTLLPGSVEEVWL